LARPADADDHSLAAAIEVEEGEELAGGSAAARLQADLRAFRKRLLEGGEIVDRAERPLGIAQHGVVARGERQHGVQRQHVAQDRRVRGAAILEEKHPLDGRKIAVRDRLDADLQARLRVAPRGLALVGGCVMRPGLSR